jgi:hypothetical protein
VIQLIFQSLYIYTSLPMSQVIDQAQIKIMNNLLIISPHFVQSLKRTCKGEYVIINQRNSDCWKYVQASYQVGFLYMYVKLIHVLKMMD